MQATVSNAGPIRILLRALTAEMRKFIAFAKTMTCKWVLVLREYPTGQLGAGAPFRSVTSDNI